MRGKVELKTVMNTEAKTESILTLTDNAAAEARNLLASEENREIKGLRVYVEKGGCSGMQYGLVFDEKREGDLVSDYDGLPVLVDAFSAQYLKGTTVDFSDALTGGGFKITNPNATQSCGCGNSFEV
jgi:iron-sulfur cluster assembly accessory protein